MQILAWSVGVLLILAMLLMPAIGSLIIGANEPRWMLFFGRFHIVLLHLPIGVMIWISVLEMANIVSRGRWYSDTTWVLGFASLATMGTAVLGYLLIRDVGSTKLLIDHQWTAIAFACLVVLTFLFRFSALMPVYYFGLVLSLVMMTVSAHFGASSVHGGNYLLEYAPWTAAKLKAAPAGAQPTPAATAAPAVSTDKSGITYQTVEPFLQLKCASCHNSEKAKGRLDVTSYAAIMKGGREVVVNPGDVEGSLLVHRMVIPLDDDDHMPPPSQLQPTPEEIDMVKAWIASGAKEGPPIVKGLPPEPAPLAIPAAPAGASREKVAPAVQQLAREFPAAVNFAAPDSGDLFVSAASFQATFDDAALAKFAPIADAVVDLDLNGSRVTDAALPEVVKMKNLDRLRLENTAVTDAALPSLKQLPKLQSLSLYGCAITDAGLPALAGIPTLKHVYLGATKVTPEGVAALNQAAPQLNIIMPPDPRNFPKETAKVAPTPDPNQKPTYFSKTIQPVLAKNCVICHNPKRLSGGLDLTTYAALAAAGDATNQVLVPGNAQESMLIQRITLPVEEKGHMPPARRPQLKPEEIALLTKWVADGGKEDQTPTTTKKAIP